MNITKSVVEMTTAILTSKLEKGEELSPSLVSALQILYQKAGELLSTAPAVRGCELSGKDPRELIGKVTAAKVGDRIWSSKGVYFLWRGMILTSVFGDTEMEKALQGLKTMDNSEAQLAWLDMNKGTKNE